jgi:hypothetical protein
VSTRYRIVVGLALVGVASVFMSGCEDTEITAPEGSTITLVAQPQSITINQEAGESRGNTSLAAQLLGSSGLPQSGVPLFFTTNGGLLGSVNNQCVNDFCADTGGACVVDSDCPAVSSTSTETNSNGIATDVLTIRLADDPETVDVTVQSTVSSTTISVGTNVNPGPTAAISATPANGARTGSPITFAAATAAGVIITCYEWQITSSNPNTRDETIYATTPTISKKYGDPFTRGSEQDLAVLLRVSGQQGVCGPGLPFSQFEDSISYRIRCDFTDPTVDAGPNVVRSLANDAQDGFVSVALRASAFDDEDPCLFYTWDCDTSGTPPACNPDLEDCCGVGASVTCKYSTEGAFSPSVTVTNQCGRLVEDNLTVQINP